MCAYLYIIILPLKKNLLGLKRKANKYFVFLLQVLWVGKQFATPIILYLNNKNI